MKKQLLSVCVSVITRMLFSFCFIGIVNAQSSIPNGNFETWDSSVFQIPMYYSFSTNAQSFFSNVADNNVARVTPGYHGSYAAQISTTGPADNPSGGALLNFNPSSGDPLSWHGGVPYNQIPTGMRGYYKCNIMPGDTALVVIMFSKAGGNVGFYILPVTGSQASYTLFNLTFSQSITPDSVGFAFLSSNLLNGNGISGSTITLDSVSLTGVSSQPADMNGDFELWQSQTVMKPASWYYNGDNQGDGMQRTTDAYAGNYALELTTYFGQRNDQPAAAPGEVATGYYPNCDSNCNELGGYPFSNQTDTLVFYYKYVPSGNDSGNVNLTFKKNGNPIYFDGMILAASGSYQLAEMPFYINSAPDTVIVDFQSSSSNNGNISLSAIGSDLKIDEVHFKSQPLNTGIVVNVFNNNEVVLYPNPVTDRLFINTGGSIGNSIISIYNTIGEIIYTEEINGQQETINCKPFPAGIYFVQLKSESGSVVKRFVKE